MHRPEGYKPRVVHWPGVKTKAKRGAGEQTPGGLPLPQAGSSEPALCGPSRPGEELPRGRGSVQRTRTAPDYLRCGLARPPAPPGGLDRSAREVPRRQRWRPRQRSRGRLPETARAGASVRLRHGGGGGQELVSFPQRQQGVAIEVLKGVVSLSRPRLGPFT